MIRWYVAYTQAQAEARAARELRQQDFDVFLPLCRRLRRHARRSETVLRPLFPRYLFLAIDLEAQGWRVINGTRGVGQLVRHGERPAPVPIGVIESLRARADRYGTVPLEALATFEPGCALRVTAGPFAGHIGRYEAMTADERVILLLDMLGRSVEIALPLLAVDAA